MRVNIEGETDLRFADPIWTRPIWAQHPILAKAISDCPAIATTNTQAHASMIIHSSLYIAIYTQYTCTYPHIQHTYTQRSSYLWLDSPPLHTHTIFLSKVQCLHSGRTHTGYPRVAWHIKYKDMLHCIDSSVINANKEAIWDRDNFENTIYDGSQGFICTLYSCNKLLCFKT